MLSDYLLTTKRNLPTLPYFLSFIFLHFTFQAEKMRRFPLRKRDNDDNKEKRSPACIFRPVRCIFPFTSQIEGKQKKGRIPFPTFPSTFLVLSMFFGIALFFSKEKRNFPLNFMFPFLRCLFHSRSKRRGCLLYFLASFLAILFSFLFSFGAYILLKNVKVAGASLSLSLLGKFLIAGGSLLVCLLFSHIGKGERR